MDNELNCMGPLGPFGRRKRTSLSRVRWSATGNKPVGACLTPVNLSMWDLSPRDGRLGCLGEGFEASLDRFGRLPQGQNEGRIVKVEVGPSAQTGRFCGHGRVVVSQSSQECFRIVSVFSDEALRIATGRGERPIAI